MTQQFTCDQCNARFDPLSGSACARCSRVLCLRCFYGRFALFTTIRALFGRRTCTTCTHHERSEAQTM